MSGWVSWAGTCRGQWTAGASSGEPPPSEPLEKGERDRVRVQKAASSTHRFLEGFRETQALPLTDALPALLRLSPRGHLPSWASHRTASSHGLCGDTKSPGLLQRIPGQSITSRSPLTATPGARYWTGLPGQMPPPSVWALWVCKVTP